MSQYELVFYGELVAGVAPEQARQHVAQLFKASADQVERMFSGKRVVIRNKLDADTARKYIVAMEKRGCVCVIEQTGVPGTAVDLDAPAAEAPAVSAPAAQTPAPTTSPQTSPASQPLPAGDFVDRDNPSGLPLAGEKAAQILEGKDFHLEPAGVRLSEEHEVDAPLFEHLDEISLAPVGSNLADKKEEVATPEPDISHLKLLDD